MDFDDWSYGTPHMVGKCPDMCPASEREMRERLQDISVFERLPGPRPYRTSKELAVKKFSRTISGNSLQSQDVRPVPVLQRTVNHLFTVLDSPRAKFEEIYSFFFDRSRSIRQELAVQRIHGKAAIDLCKPIIRFHIMASYELCDVTINRFALTGSDAHQNMEQLMKALSMILNFYERNCARGKNMEEDSQEGEFWGYHLLLNMGLSDTFQASSPCLCLKRMSRRVLGFPEVKFARAVMRTLRWGNYYAFSNLLKEATYLQACIMNLYLSKVRETALAVINRSCYKAQPYPLKDLLDVLFFTNEAEVEALCSHYGLSFGADERGTKVLIVKQSSMNSSVKGWPPQVVPLIEGKRRCDRATVVT